MRKGLRQIVVGAGAALLVVPTVSRAASVVLSLVGVQTSTTSNFAAGTVTNWTPGVGSAPTPVAFASVPAGGLYLRYGVRAVVTNNPNPAVAGGYLIDTDDDGIGDRAQPAQLGIGAFGAYITHTGSATNGASPVGMSGGPSTAAVNALFASVSSAGTISNNTVGDPASPASFIAGGTNSGAVNAGFAGNLLRLAIGTSTAGSPAPGSTAADNNLFATLTFFIPPTSAGANITTHIPTSSFAFVVNKTPGDTTTAPTYTNRNFDPAIDTLTGPGSIITVIPEPSLAAVVGAAGLGRIARRRSLDVASARSSRQT